MTGRYWLASYPKSGNTWLRIMLARLQSGDADRRDLRALLDRDTIASAPDLVEDGLLIDPGALTHDEIDHFRSLAHAAAADEARTVPTDGGAPPARLTFVKVHDAYLTTPAGLPLLGGGAAANGAVVIVRDPRDVVLSLASHFGWPIEAAADFVNDPKAALVGAGDRRGRQFRQRIGDWSAHLASWLDQTDLRVRLVRYEDMLEDPATALRGVLEFVGREADAAAIDAAVRYARFSELQREEAEKGFRESPRHTPGHRFFRAGTAGQWRQHLPPQVVTKVEARHAAMMTRLGYPLETGRP